MKKMRPVLYIVLLIMVFGTGYYIGFSPWIKEKPAFTSR